MQEIAKSGVDSIRVSVILETKAILPVGAPNAWDLPYLNLVLLGSTSLSPYSLFEKLKKIEKELGRDLQAPRWSPRVIDLDILAWGDEVLAEGGLVLPHPELMNRPFLLGLMAQLGADWRFPVPGFPYSFLTLADILHSHVHFEVEGNSFVPFPQMVGVVNVTPDSFSDGEKCIPSRRSEKAVQKIQDLISQGAAVIDLGAQSTRPGAISVSFDEEWRRLEPVFDFLAQDLQNRQAKVKISLDSFCPEVLERALRCYPVDWINDVTGGKNERLLEVVSGTRCRIILSHSLEIPPSKGAVLPFEKKIFPYIFAWAERAVERLHLLGISQDRIILDPGIGFGKSAFQSLSLLREIDDLKRIGCEVLVGHSRKSFLRVVTGADASSRDLETVGVSCHLMMKGVDYLRVHNVEAHQRSLSALMLLYPTRCIF